MYNGDVIDGIEKYNQDSNEINSDEDNTDPLLSEAIEYVIETGKVSTTF